MRRVIVESVLQNSSLLHILLVIRHEGDNLLTPEDSVTIKQHMNNHRRALRMGIESIRCHSIDSDADTMKCMPKDVYDIIYDYIMPISN